MTPFRRRPILGAAVSLIAGMLLGKIEALWLLFLFLILAIMWIVWMLRRHTMHAIYIVIIGMTILGYVRMVPSNQPISYVSQIETNEEDLFCELTGEVRKISVTEYGTQYELKNVRVKDAGSLGRYRVLIRSGEKEALYQIGDEIHVMGDAGTFSAPRNPGEFDQKAYYAACKVAFYVKANRITCIKSCNNPILLLANLCSKRLSEAFHHLADDRYASVFDAMLLGNRDELDDEIYELFSVCGIGHILAISGLHISMLGMGLYRMIRRMGLPVVPAMLVGTGFILFYGLVTGNGTSTMRALIMFVVAVYAHTQKRSYDVLTAASFAAILMLLDSPQYLFHCGFLLSYGAILGITILSPAMESQIPKFLLQKDHVWQRILLHFIKSILGSFSISAVTMPITLYFYFQIPSLAVFLNLIVIPFMTILMASALLGGAGALVSVNVGIFCMGPAIYILKFYEWLCEGMLKIPWSILQVGRPKAWQILVYYGLLLFLVWLAAHPQLWQKKVRTWLSLGSILIAFLIIILRFHFGLEAVFLDVGQGDGIFLRTDDGTTILVDGGSSSKQQLAKNTLKPFLQSQGVTVLDYWIMTHADADHTSGMLQLIKTGEIIVQTVILPDTELSDERYKNVEKAAKANGAEILYVSRGDRLTSGHCTLTFLHPTPQYETEERNAYSTSFLLSYGDFQMLCCGDVGEEEEFEILDALNDLVKVYENGLWDGTLEILKANHHGSAYSNSSVWLSTLQPQNYVISCGINNAYGHPHAETLERLEQFCKGLQGLYRTDQNGAILISVPFSSSHPSIRVFWQKSY